MTCVPSTRKHRVDSLTRLRLTHVCQDEVHLRPWRSRPPGQLLVQLRIRVTAVNTAAGSRPIAQGYVMPSGLLDLSTGEHRFNSVMRHPRFNCKNLHLKGFAAADDCRGGDVDAGDPLQGLCRHRIIRG
jgi:hypothetical protein